MSVSDAARMVQQCSSGMANRVLLQVRLTEDARAGVDRIVSRRGITITALLEATGRLQPPLDDDVVALARQIDRERRSRR